MRRPAALVLMITGQSALALLAPSVALVPAFTTFLAASLILTRS